MTPKPIGKTNNGNEVIYSYFYGNLVQRLLCLPSSGCAFSSFYINIYRLTTAQIFSKNISWCGNFMNNK